MLARQALCLQPSANNCQPIVAKGGLPHVPSHQTSRPPPEGAGSERFTRFPRDAASQNSHMATPDGGRSRPGYPELFHLAERYVEGPLKDNLSLTASDKLLMYALSQQAVFGPCRWVAKRPRRSGRPATILDTNRECADFFPVQ